MDHQQPAHDAKKPAPPAPKPEDALAGDEYVQPIVNTLESGKVQAASGSLNSKQIIALQRLVGNHQTGRLLNRISPAPRRIQRFEKQAEVRKNQFITSATAEKKITPEQAEQLYAMVSGGQVDPVTGFEDPTDYDPTMARAIDEVKNKNEAAFNVNVSIRNLAGLNEKRGHTGADSILGEFAEIVSKALDQVGGSVSKFRHGTELQFIIVGKDVRQSHIEAQLMVAQADIQREATAQGLDKIQHPKHQGIIGDQGTGIQYDIRVIKASNNADESGAAAQGAQAHGRGDNFKNAAQDRKAQFIKMAVEQFGLSESKATELYTTSGADAVDSLTGFDKAADRITTLKSAITYCGEKHIPGMYIEVDVRNLGGLTQEKGRDVADAAYRTMASMAETALMTLKADVSRFRHGGDEFSFILVGAEATAEAITRALTDAQTQIAAYVKAQGLQDVVHPKHPTEVSKRGTGIIFGLCAITGATGEAPEAILSTADQQVETKKKA